MEIICKYDLYLFTKGNKKEGVIFLLLLLFVSVLFVSPSIELVLILLKVFDKPNLSEVLSAILTSLFRLLVSLLLLLSITLYNF